MNAGSKACVAVITKQHMFCGARRVRRKWIHLNPYPVKKTVDRERGVGRRCNAVCGKERRGAGRDKGSDLLVP